MDRLSFWWIFSLGIFFLFMGRGYAQNITEPVDHWTITKHFEPEAMVNVDISGPILEVNDKVEGGAVVAFEVNIRDDSEDAQSNGLWLALRTSRWPEECRDLDLSGIQSITYAYQITPKSLELGDPTHEREYSLRTGVTQADDRGRAFANSDEPLQMDGEWHTVNVPIESLVVERVEGQTEDWDLTHCGAFWVAMGGFSAYNKANFMIKFANIQFVPKT